MSKYYKDLNLLPLSENKFELIKDYNIEDINIPKGFKTDGATIPQFFWWFVPPFKPKYLPAVVLHDYLCDKEQYELADELFKKVLFDIEKSFATKTMVKSVKIYHKIKYGV